MKRRIRLTKSGLRRMIYEALDELDWKTYANAERVARGRGNISYWRDRGDGEPGDWLRNATAHQDRADRFGDAARSAFDLDYGYQRGEDGADDDFVRIGMGRDVDSLAGYRPHAAAWKRGDIFGIDTYPHGALNTADTPEEFFGDDTDALDAYNRADDEIGGYNRGEYDYRDGEGWRRRDESVRRKIDRAVRESVRRALVVENTQDIFNDIVSRFDDESDLVRAMQKDGCSSIYEYLNDMIRDNYNVPLSQRDELCRRIKEHYGIGRFYFDEM